MGLYNRQIIILVAVIAHLKSLVVLSAVPVAAIEVGHWLKLSASFSGIGTFLTTEMVYAGHPRAETSGYFRQELLAQLSEAER